MADADPPLQRRGDRRSGTADPAPGSRSRLPTETVYGLAADATNAAAVARIYEAKGRPASTR